MFIPDVVSCSMYSACSLFVWRAWQPLPHRHSLITWSMCPRLTYTLRILPKVRGFAGYFKGLLVAKYR